jgi:hypothetical protein
MWCGFDGMLRFCNCEFEVGPVNELNCELL